MTVADFAFYVFSAILLIAAIMVVTSRNPVHSVLFLIVAFINAAVLFLIAGAEFLAMVLAIVYVGAVAVLFLFVVMMLDVDFAALREGYQRYAPIGLAVGLVLAIELGVVLAGFTAAPAAMTLRLSPTPVDLTNTAAIGSILYTQYFLLFQLAGLLLLVAMIGAIVLTLRDRKRGKTQNINRQLARTPAVTLSLSRPVLGAGAKLPVEPARPIEREEVE
jgi:NADH-quinone oxidoreductase subunit J